MPGAAEDAGGLHRRDGRGKDYSNQIFADACAGGRRTVQINSAVRGADVHALPGACPPHQIGARLSSCAPDSAVT